MIPEKCLVTNMATTITAKTQITSSTSGKSYSVSREWAIEQIGKGHCKLVCNMDFLEVYRGNLEGQSVYLIVPASGDDCLILPIEPR